MGVCFGNRTLEPSLGICLKSITPDGCFSPLSSRIGRRNAWHARGRFVVSTSALVSQKRTFEYQFCQWKHIPKRLCENDILIGPISCIRERTMLPALFHLTDLVVGRCKLVVPSDHRSGTRHEIAEFLVQRIRIFFSTTTSK